MTAKPKIFYTESEFHALRPTLPDGLDRAEYCDWPLDLTPEWYQLWFADLVGKLRSEIAAGYYSEGRGDLTHKIKKRYSDLYYTEISAVLDAL